MPSGFFRNAWSQVENKTNARLSPQPDGSVTAVNMPLSALIEFAYTLPPDRIQGIPDWAVTTRYDITTKAEAVSNPITPINGPVRSGLLLRSLLADRFKLKVHSETRELPVYELRLSDSAAKLGPRLVPSTRDCRALVSGVAGRGTSTPTPAQENQVPCGIGIGVGYVRAGGVPLTDLAEALGRTVQRTVIDRTSLKGNFDAELAFNPEQFPTLPLPLGVAPRIDPNAPSIFTAVEEQLGLRLESARGSVDVLAIDSVERPTPD